MNAKKRIFYMLAGVLLPGVLTAQNFQLRQNVLPNGGGGAAAGGNVIVQFNANAVATGKAPKFIPALGWDRSQQGGFATCVIADAQNAIWVGTEGNGVWRYDPREKKWGNFTVKDGLGDDCVYALAVDKTGRVWAGHLNHGVSVWNGEKWKNYGFTDGPLGDRVFAIAVCPTDGDVWIATDCGVARYSLSKDDWDYFTRASGLPSDQIQGIAFDSDGDVYLGTQCDGVAMASASDNYRKWNSAGAPLRVPNAGAGEGIPSNLINSMVTRRAQSALDPNGTEMILALTPDGLAGTTDRGRDWGYMRGEDWQINMNGMADAPPPDLNAHPLQFPFAEDWITCLRQEKETKRGWLGYREKGLEVREVNGQTVYRVDTEGVDPLYVRGIWLGPKSPPLIAIDDPKHGGLFTLDNVTATLEPRDDPPKTPPAFPSPAKAPTADTIAPLAKRIEMFKNQMQNGEAIYLGDDWRTGGDWVGRYGNSYAYLCGLRGEKIYQGEPGFDAQLDLGPHHQDTQVNVSKTDSSDNPRSLYDPMVGHRRDAEADDGSTAKDLYPATWDGPDLALTVTVPDGVHCLSLYFHNIDAHEDGMNNLRDYDLQVLPWSKSVGDAFKSEPIARARVIDFWGGVYKQFIIMGPSKFMVRIGRHRSFGTRLQGVFIDRLSESENDRTPLPGFDKAPYEPRTLKDTSVLDKDPTLSATNELWMKLDSAFDKRGVVPLQIPLRLWAYRAAVSAHAPDELLEMWRWQMSYWKQEDRDAFQKATADAYKAFTAEQGKQGNN